MVLYYIFFVIIEANSFSFLELDSWVNDEPYSSNSSDYDTDIEDCFEGKL